jgi:hypothetical protein
MNLTLTVDEANIILSKLNTSSFTGFTEASIAVTIFGKIKSANIKDVSVPQSLQKEVSKPQSDSSNLGPKPMAELSRKFAAPPIVPTPSAPTINTSLKESKNHTVAEDAIHVEDQVNSEESVVPAESTDVDENSKVEETVPDEGETSLPVAPMKSLSEAREENLAKESKKTGDLVPPSSIQVPDEDAGVFSIIDKTKKTATVNDYT